MAERLRHLIASERLATLMGWSGDTAWRILKGLGADDIIALTNYMIASEIGRKPDEATIKRVDELMQRYRFWVYDPRGGVPIPVCRDARDGYECCERLGGERIYAYDNIVECRMPSGETIDIVDLEQ